MIENSFVKKIVGSVMRNRQAAALDKNIMHPKREWFIGIFIGLLFLSAGITWSYITYSRFSNIDIDEPGEELEEVVYRESLVNTALFDFSTRKKGYETLKAELIGKRKLPPPAVVAEEVSVEPPSSGEVNSTSDEIDLVQFQ